MWLRISLLEYVAAMFLVRDYVAAQLLVEYVAVMFLVRDYVAAQLLVEYVAVMFLVRDYMATQLLVRVCGCNVPCERLYGYASPC